MLKRAVLSLAVAVVLVPNPSVIACNFDPILKNLAQGADPVVSSQQSAIEQALNEGGKHPAISSRGVNFTKEVMASGMLPRGCALITSSGNLAKSGITSVIHAASGSMTQEGKEFEPSNQGVQSSVRNAMELARLHGHKRVAVPFIGGKIFLDRIGGTPQELADKIVGAALENRGDLEIRFVLFSPQEAEIFRKSVATQSRGKLPTSAVDVVTGSITEFKVHGASAIVNAANMEVTFGGGLSGAIGRSSGAAEAINTEARNHITSFNTELKSLLP